MKKRILIDANFPTETRIVLLDKNNNVEDVEYSSVNKKQIKGNIYLAKVTRVEPALQAAFVDYGDEKSGFLPFNEIHPDYYNILARDKKSDAPSWNELSPPEITSEDLMQTKEQNIGNEVIVDNDEIDISKIEKLVDEKIQSDFDIEVEDNEVESFSKEDVHSDTRKACKIQEVIKKGQILLVQVTKEERGNKGVSLTTYISLAGKYCVLMPNKPLQNGISRKISNQDERKRLKDIINSLLSSKNKETSSVIARTAGVGHTSLEIKKDYEYLVKLWNRIREATLKANAPSFIHQEDGLILKTIRDMFDRNVKEVLVQGTVAFNICIKFVKDIMPYALNSIKEYKGTTPIFTKFNVEDQLAKLYQPIVQLPSGGYIVINPTEALISIDVNSGRATSERNIEEMALKNNLEAAREIARQVKLRDLSGLLVLDFIDMAEVRNRKIVERTLREFLSKDKARIQTSHISSFGLLEMSRQRLRPSFLEVNSNICLHCSGKGIVRADESNSMLILRTIENEIYNNNYDIVNIYGIASSMLYLLNNKREEISFIEKKYSIKLNFYIDKEATADSYSIEKIKLSEKNKSENIIKLPLLQDSSEIYIQTSEVKKTNPKNKKIQKHDLLEPNQYSEERSKSEVVENTTAKDIETAKIAAQQEDIAPESLINDRTKHVSKSRKRINRRRGSLPRNKNSNNENQSKIVVNDKE
ncbi:MAG: Rne/Rng family ribonuclease [Alphaproteobacteria bacterium]|jgi:ribonuclease E|nr:Rne/Rng family ribonuclease [Alphaproteobacteria bacterium]